MMRTLRLLARMATASVGGYWALGLHAIADTACKACLPYACGLRLCPLCENSARWHALCTKSFRLSLCMLTAV